MTKFFNSSGLAVFFALFALAAQLQASNPSDDANLAGHWPQWRGPNGDNVSTETELLRAWPEEGPPLEWKLRGIGEGIASVAVAGGRIYTLGYIGASEYVTALDQRSGKRIWAARIGEAVEERSIMRWLSQRTPTVDDDRLYAFTSRGQLICLSVADGKEVWRRGYIEDFGARSNAWGLCDYPLLDGDRLICTPGGTSLAIAALNKFTGDVIWKSDFAGRPDWSAVVVTEAGGVRQFVTFMWSALVGVAADDGRLLWKYEEKLDSFHGCTPIVHEDYVFCSNGRRADAILLKLSAKEGGGVAVNKVYYRRSSIDLFQDVSVLVDGHIYVMGRGGRALCLRFESGELAWQADRIVAAGRAGWTYVDGHLYQLHSNGRMALVKATPHGYLEHGMFMIPGYQPAAGATLPVVAAGRLYVRNDDQLFCYHVGSDALNQPRAESKQIVLDIPSPQVADKRQDQRRSVFVPTPIDVVEKMLQLADVQKTDVVYDLGSGDGRIVITAAKDFGCKAVGYEIDSGLVESSRNRAKEAMVESKVSIVNKDLFTVDLRDADVIAVYLLPKQLEALMSQFEELKPGSRIVSHQFEIPGIEPTRTVQTVSREDNAPHAIHLWTTPLGDPRTHNKSDIKE